MKQLHTDDIVAGDGQIMRRQMVENFETIQQEDAKDDSNFVQEVKDRKDVDNKLQDRIDKLQERCQKLEQEKATLDELKDVQETWKKKIEHVALGTDYEKVEQAVMQILEEKGLV